MGINMDIRNESEYAFLDLDDLDDREKNEIRAILRPPTAGVDALKLPWDIGEKEYELNSEVAEEQAEEDVSAQWQHCDNVLYVEGMTESIASYDACGVSTSPIMTTMPPGHHYAGHQMMVYNEIPSIPGNPYANSAAGDPNAYSFVPRLQYGPPPMYSSDSELASPAPTRDNERRRGRSGRGGGAGNSNKDSYNPGSDMQKVMLPPGYAQFHYNPQRPSDSPHVLSMCPSSGTIYSVSPQAHSAAGIRIYFPPQNPYPSQNPQMYRHNHPSYGHHPSTYQPESHMNTKYVRGSQGQATYYNQDSQKSVNQKHHETRVLQRDNGPTSTPPFRHGSTNSEVDATKKNHGKTLAINVNSSGADARDAADARYNVHNNNATSYLCNNKNITPPFRHGTSNSEVDPTKKNHGKSHSAIFGTGPTVADAKDIVVRNNDAASYIGNDKKITPPFRHGSSNAEIDTSKKNHGKSLPTIVNASVSVADRRDATDARDSAVHNNNAATYSVNDKKVTPPFRQGSSISEIDTAKKNQGKSLSQIVNSGVTIADTRDGSVHNNNTARHSDVSKKVTFSIDQAKIEMNDASAIKEDHSEKTTVEKKELLPTAAISNNTVTASGATKDKANREKGIISTAEDKVATAVGQAEIPNQSRSSAKFSENVEQNESKNTREEPVATKTSETSVATLLTNAPSPVSTAPAPPPSVSWANVLKKGGPPMDSMRSTPPITKLPVARVTPISLPPPPVESAPPPPKTSTQDVTRNETVASTANRNNNTETTPKAPEAPAWAETKVPAESTQQNNLNDPAVFRMGEHLLKYQMDKQTVSLLPRGLTNRSNYCYINSILQALLACPPFYNLLMDLPYRRSTTKNSSTPLIDNMARFVREFNPLTEGARVHRKDRSQKRGEETAADVQCGIAFEPSYVYTMLKNTSCAGVFSVEGRQEDAEEFLSCLLNGISDEMLELMKLVNSESNDTVSDESETNVNFNNVEEEWKVMGPKNKGSITRCTEFGRTPLSDIFRGQLRSRILRTGEEATDNVQPFFTLQLDIEKAESVEVALETLVGRDQVEGMTCSKTKQQIEAWKQVTLEELPVILILHLKWFDYKMDGCSKIFKRVGFPIDLKLDSKLLSPSVAKKLIRKQKQYKLFAVTYHDGKEASKGHYVTDAFHVGYGSWVRYDDSSVKGIYEYDVLNPTPPRVPYLLYYRRCDTIGNNQPNTPRTR